MIRNPLLVLISFSTLFSGCTQLISLETPTAARQLVVDGSINQLREGNWLRLSTSTEGLEAVGSNTLGRNADVMLIHGEEIYAYEEVEPGNYFLPPDQFQGQVGETYFIRIITNNNRVYESNEVTIPKPVGFASSRAELVAVETETFDGTIFTNYFHDVFATFINESDDQFIKIDNSGISEVFVDYPLPLCGSFETLPRGPAAGLRCWAEQDPISREIQLAANAGITRTADYEVLGVRVPFLLRARYVATMIANNMSVNSFNYWENVRLQLNNVGGPFDPPIAPIQGNVRNVDDPQEIVLGYFHAYGTSKTQTCFDWLDVPEGSDIPILPPPCFMTCAEFWAPASFNEPVGLAQCSN